MSALKKIRNNPHQHFTPLIRGCAVLLRGRAPWIQGGNQRRIPSVRDPEVCHPYAAQFF